MNTFWGKIEALSQRDEDYKDWNMNIYFYGYEVKTRNTLFSILTFLMKMHQFIQLPKVPTIYIGIFLNIFHLVVLTRKTMRVGSVNMILISLAIHDILFIVLKLFWNDLLLWNDDECKPIRLTLRIKIVNTIEMFLRRSSSWLVISMATVRTCCIAFIENPRTGSLITTKFGIYAAIVEFFVSCLFSMPLIWFLCFNSLSVPGHHSTFEPPIECGFPEGYNITYYDLDYPFDVERRDEAINGITIHLIPSIFYPILTIVLVRALIKSNENKKRLRQDTGKDRTTHIVIAMTVSFMISEVPQGICYVWELAKPGYGFGLMLTMVKATFTIITLINASTHSIICFTLSSNYREAVFSMLKLPEKRMIFRPRNPTIQTSQVAKSRN